MVKTNPPPLRGIPQELATFLRQLWIRTGGANDNISDAQTESFNGLNTAVVQSLRQDIDYLKCQMSTANQLLMAQRQEIDCLQQRVALSSATNSSLHQKLNDLEVKAWL